MQTVKVELNLSPAAARRCRWAITRTIWALEWIGARLAGLVENLRGLRRRCQ